jgi:hypothetical protein
VTAGVRELSLRQLICFRPGRQGPGPQRRRPRMTRGRPGRWARRWWSASPPTPKPKGLIERCPDYLERSFLPGRDFASPADFNAQLGQWLAVVNTRRRRWAVPRPTGSLLTGKMSAGFEADPDNRLRI